MRYDIISRKDGEELQQLLDNVKPIPIGTIHAILKQAYGKPHEMVFRRFDIHPIGSASVSQVHRAEMWDGRVVAVKIKRPNVDKQFYNDIRILKRLARIAALFSVTLRRVQIRALVGYFENWIKQDLDFGSEIKNMRRYKEQYSFTEDGFRSDLGKTTYPSPYEFLCSDNIIVMDYIEGLPMSRQTAILANPAYNIEKSIKTFVNAALRNWFNPNNSSYLFQADPHLSNILALPGGDVASIDYGLVCELSRQEAKQAQDLIIAVYLQDIQRTVKVATEMTGADYQTFAPILRPHLEIYLEKTKNEGFGFWFLEFAKIMVKNKIQFPLYLTTFGRTNLMLDGLVKTYLPNKTTVDLVGNELKRAAMAETLQNVADIDWLRVGYTLSKKVKQTPEFISALVESPLDIISEIAKAMKTPA
jgi:ubiquinone biosynthesis protein